MFWLIKQLAAEEFAQWRRLVDIRALAKLSDHQLDDIGLRRDQLFMLEARRSDGAWERPVSETAFRPGFEPCG
jgi:uncharacterized protein YjiS (DUF1127 family)